MWKGNLPIKSQVNVPELIPPADSVSIAMLPNWPAAKLFSPPAAWLQIPREPPGSRMVLFLQWCSADSPCKGDPLRDWAPANGFDDFKTSAAWIDNGTPYAFMQVNNPGPGVLVELGTSVQN